MSVKKSKESMKETVKEIPVWGQGYQKVVKRTLEESDRVDEVLNIT